MTYKCLVKWHDLKDKNNQYNIGDEYPRKGLKPSKKRIEELSNKISKKGVPFIEEIVEESTNEEN